MPSYRVCGETEYNGHAPGSVFSAEADEAIERAVARGSIAHFSEADATPPTEKIVQEVVKKLNVESHRGS